MRKLVLLFLLLTAGSLQLRAQTCSTDAGADQTLCNNVYGVWLNTAAANDYVTWTSSGTGYFDDMYTTNPTYYPSADDRNSTGVTLTMTSNQAFCTGGTLVDVMNVTFLAAPTLNVNIAQSTICSDVAGVQGISLFGMVAGQNTFSWSTSGTGTFAPNANVVNVNYVASAADIASGSISFTAEATASNSCITSRDLDVTILSTPTVDAGADYTACSNTISNFYLYPTSFTGGNTVVWTGGAGTMSAYGNTDAYYYPTAAEIASSSITFTATITSSCGTASDQQVVSIDQAYTLDAGLDRNICLGTTTLSFNAVTNSPSITWTTSGAGTFNNTNTTTPVYNFTPSEQAGAYFYSFQADIPANGACGAYTDYINVYTINPPTIDAGLDFTVCAAQNARPVAYAGYGIDNVMWTGGTGTWMSPGTSNPIYVPSAAERTAGTVTLTVTGMGVCPNTSDNVTITFDSRYVDLTAGGPYTQYCSDIAAVTLNGSLMGGFTGCQWSIVNGSGSFADQFSASTTYTPGWLDTYSPVQLELMANDPLSVCGDVRDTVTLIFVNPPTADWPYSYNSPVSFGACIGDTLWLSVSNASSISWTANAGSGSFVGTTATEDYTRFVPAPGAQTVNFTLNATGLTGCGNITNQMLKANIHSFPTSNAGSDDMICNPTKTYTMNGNPPPGSLYDGYWYNATGGGVVQEPKRTRQALTSGSVFFDDNSLYNTTASFNATGAYDLVWAMTQRWSDMDTGEGWDGCTSNDTVTIIYVDKPDLVQDTIIAQAGLVTTKNVLTNDNLYGLSYTITQKGGNGMYSENVVAFQASTGTFSYLNRTPLYDGRDTLRYTVTVTGCGSSSDEDVIVYLVNGPPYTPDTAKASITVHKAVKETLMVPLKLKQVFADYNDNIDWSTLTFISSASTATFAPDIVNREDTIKYNTPRSAVFAGEDVITFSVCDNLGACYVGKYYIEVIPDYEHPSVKGEDFVVINAVSPNGDGVHDDLYIYGIAEYDATVTIYNRWNQKVWEGYHYNNNSVKFEGVGNQPGVNGPLPEGTYFYVVKNENKDVNGENKGLHSGYLELRR